MDESIFTSPLEVNLNKLIKEQFFTWNTKIQHFLKFTDRKTTKSRALYLIFVVVMELEREKAELFSSFKTEFLPAKCLSWLKIISSSSADFVKVYNEDFRVKLARELVDLQTEQRDSLASLKEATALMKDPSKSILKNLTGLMSHFSSSKTHRSGDPWINELAVRHYSALFLEKKANYLDLLLKIYAQVKHLHEALSLKLASLSEEYFRILERFGMSVSNADVNLSGLNPFGSQISTWDEVILKQFSLDYDWKLECPPLDGFLSTLFSNLKSLGATFSLQISKSSGIPKIFPEQSLRVGFLQKSVSGLLSRSWQVFFVVLQPSTGFLHFYKTSSSSSSTSTKSSSAGNLLVPSIGTTYTKSSLQDLNILATQFFLQNPHQPASLSSQILIPSLSISLSQDSKTAAIDPINFTFVLKPNVSEKVTLRAFCEEEFVDWVIFLNDASKTESPSPKRDSMPLSESHDQSTSSSPSTSSSSGSPSSSLNSPPPFTTSSSATVVDLENPWN